MEGEAGGERLGDGRWERRPRSQAGDCRAALLLRSGRKLIPWIYTHTVLVPQHDLGMSWPDYSDGVGMFSDGGGACMCGLFAVEVLTVQHQKKVMRGGGQRRVDRHADRLL
ncbi:hypothetical protein EYF80_037057 [Liparis tanakae]|uniref:Uncharacterized protein n=1 Tax=Liparis tanakae TaxID=230148 RepID=A0A4Z2GIR0_9TELE|nr:hypothetical protein EYF80_037057 [Liparis tanakae]